MSRTVSCRSGSYLGLFTVVMLTGVLASLPAAAAESASSGASPAPAALPRYAFVPGQRLTYRSSSLFRYKSSWSGQEGAFDDRDDWTVWVVRGNPDGSSRLLLRQRTVSARVGGGQRSEGAPTTQIYYADVFPDGRLLPNPSFEYRGRPGLLFPPLPPAPAAVKAGWETMRREDRVVCKQAASEAGFVFDASIETPLDKIYLFTDHSHYTFDSARGLVVKAETANSQGWGAKGSGAGKLELVEVAPPGDAEASARLAADADRYFAALEAYRSATRSARRAKPDECKELLRSALAELKDSASRVTQPDLKADLDAKVKDHDSTATSVTEEAESRAKRIGKPAPAFDLTDLDSKPVRLADLRGKVVVLDFWYRGCGWCIRSMPQINQLVDDFAGQPVAFYGMNTDRDEADARFVLEKMALKYPTLKAEGQPEKFGVEGFPTLVVIDQKGNVRHLHVGYSPTLRQELGDVIRGMLREK